MDSRAIFHNNGNQIQRHEFKILSFQLFLRNLRNSNLMLHSPFVFKGREEEDGVEGVGC